MKPEIESLQSYVALSFIVIGFLIRFSPAYLGLSFPYHEWLVNTISFALFFMGLPIAIYQITKFDTRLTIFYSSASILFLLAAYFQFELLAIINLSPIVLIVKLFVLLFIILGLVILMAGIGYNRGLKMQD
ncbi:hypothetical protein [Aquibacillus albus]|uniref:Uncharacterized protein n=1 Tax=Aquibacillus albus TaxID=1168171 RepID=A0ABS2MWD4_9BACI|nr:hypothetical protein [Aquibacillus albus]MBM7570160.1 hypothetical protein [Aquibacillus albus]